MFGKHRVCLLLTFDVLVGSKSPKKKKKKELFLQNFFRNRSESFSAEWAEN